MAALLYETFPQVFESRLTGVWHSRRQNRDRGGDAALLHLVELPSDQHVDLEGDWLANHLPASLGGVGGVFPDGRPWLITVQQTPVRQDSEASDGLGWLEVALHRALRFNPGARASRGRPLLRAEMLAVYTQAAADTQCLQRWSTTELLVGMLAHCCGATLPDLVAGYDRGCSLPDVDHSCQLDVFEDAFVSWQSRLIAPGGGSTPPRTG